MKPAINGAVLSAVAALLLNILGLPAQAQTWFTQTAEWHYSHWVNFSYGYVHVQVAGDTIIQGDEYKILAQTIHSYDSNDQSYSEYPWDTLYLSYDQGVVWIYVPHQSSRDTLLNMNAHPGDSWMLAEMPDPQGIFPPDQYCTVIDTFTTTIDGVPLRTLAMAFNYEGQFGENYLLADTIIERIGTIGSYMLPYDWLFSTLVNFGGPLRCYRDEDIEFLATDEACDLGLGLWEATSKHNSLVIYPNPGNEITYVTVPSGFERGRLSVYDMQGREIFGYLISSPAPTEFLLSDLGSGVYLISLAEENGRIWRSTLIRN